MAYDKPIAVITIACEASGESHVARLGVAASLFNRLHVGRYGKTIAAVCLKRMQYSEWNADRIDNANLLRVANMAVDDPVILDCANAYDEAAAGADPTYGATHFFADSIQSPAWTVGATKTVQLGSIVFYRDVA